MRLELLQTPDHPVTVVVVGEVRFPLSLDLVDTTLRAMTEHGPHLILDLGAVSFLDVSGLHALWVIDDQANLRGGHLTVLRPSAWVRRMLEAAGARTRLDIRDGPAAPQLCQ